MKIKTFIILTELLLITGQIYGNSPNGSISGNGPFCSSGTAELTFTKSGGDGPFTIVYRETGGSDITVNNVSSGSVFASFLITSTKTFELVSITDKDGHFRNSGFTSGSTTIVVRPVPNVNIIGTNTVCKGATSPNVTFINPQTIPVTVTYNINGGVSTTIDVSASSSSNVAAPAGPGVFQYNLVSVAYQNAPTCGPTSVSGQATVTIVEAPSIITQPTSPASVCTGGAVGFSLLSSTGTGLLTYEWKYDTGGGTYNSVVDGTPTGAIYTGANTSALSVSGISSAGTYNYKCFVSDCSLPSTESNVVTVTVENDISVTNPISPAAVCAGATPDALTISATAGSIPVSYEWFSNTTNSNSGGASTGISGNIYVPSGATAGVLYYYCEVTPTGDACTVKTTSTASVIVAADPEITSQPVSPPAICQGGTTSDMTIAALGGTPALTYNWQYFDGTTWNDVVNATPAGAIYTGGTGATFSVTGISIPGSYSYHCVVSAGGSDCASVTSSAVTVIVVPGLSITSQPSSPAAICAGGNGNMTVAVSAGTSLLSYQWKYDAGGGSYAAVSNGIPGGAVYTGANDATLTVSSITSQGTYNYKCFITDCSTTVESNAASLTVVSDPSVSVQPVSPVSVCVGGTLPELSVTATGGVPSLTYQWYSNTVNSNTGGTILTGQNLTGYTPPNTSPGTLYYYVIIKASGSGCDDVNSNTAAVGVAADPEISLQPVSPAAICQGGTTSDMTITASGGTPALTYNWQYFDGTTWNDVVNATPAGAIYTGGTGMTFSVTGISIPGSYTYHCVVSAGGSDCASVTSSPVIVTVVPALSITSQPSAPGAICAGGTSGNMSVTVSAGTPLLTYQWKYDTGGSIYSNVSNGTPSGATYTGGTTGTLAVSGISSAGSYNYKCFITDCSSTAESNAATVTVVSDPAVTVHPVSPDAICTGGTLSPLSVTAINGTPSLKYQWYSNSVDNNTTGISLGSGAQLSTYTPPNASAGTLYYYVVVSALGSGCENAISNTATVSVAADPVINSQPVSPAPICAGGTTSNMTIAATGGTPSLTYKWQYYNGSAWNDVADATPAGAIYTGETGSSFSVSGITDPGNYTYQCIVSASGSDCASVTSSPVTVTVASVPSITIQPESPAAICTGGASATMIIAATGGAPSLIYQWKYYDGSSWINVSDGTPSGAIYSGSTGTNFSVSGITAAGSHDYKCFISSAGNGCSAVMSNIVTLQVAGNPAITADPVSPAALCTGGTLSPLSVTAINGTPSLKYQWYSNTVNSNSGGSILTGQTSAVYNPSSAVAGTTYYYVVVRADGSGCTTVTSSTAAIDVKNDPSISVQPVAPTPVCDGSSVPALSVTASNGLTLSFQWYSNTVDNTLTGTNLGAGAQSSSYSPANTPAGILYYYCKITSTGTGCDAVSSNTAAVSVKPLPAAFAQTPPSLCEDNFGSLTHANVNLTTLNNAITGGTAERTVTWYTDASHTTLVTDPLAAIIHDNDVLYPLITNTNPANGCINYTTAAFDVTPKVNLSSVTLSGVARQGAVLTVNYLTAGFCLPEVVESTQIEWYRNTTNSGTGTKFSTVSGDSKTYTLTSTDNGKYLRVGVKISDGTASLFDVVYSNWTTQIQDNLVPSVDPSSISITGTLQQGQTLTAHYTYTDAEGDAESGSTYTWYKAYAAPGLTPAPGDYSVIAGETGITHVISNGEQGYWFKFSVTPRAGTNNTAFGSLAMINAGFGPANKQPEALNVTITGIQEVGQKLQGNYTYYDADNDAEGTSTFRWFKNGVPIAGATDKVYYLASEDEGGLISFEVTPVTATGFPLTGTAVTSPQTGVIQPLTTDFVNFKDKYCYGEGSTTISVKNVPSSAYNKQFRCTNPNATIIKVDAFTVVVNPSQMTPIRPTGGKVDSLIYSFTDFVSGLRYKISRAFVIDSIGLKLGVANINPAYCIDAGQSAITVEGMYPLGGTGAWTDPANLLSDKVTTGPSQGATINPGRGVAGNTYTITYQYTSPKGCLSEPVIKTVKINPLPNPGFVLNQTYNIDGGAITLVPAQKGGTFAGTGVSGNKFLPDVAGTGNFIITYSITDNNSCFNSLPKTTTVKRAQGSISGLQPKICYKDTTYAVSVSNLPVGSIPARFSNRNNSIQYTPGTTTAIYDIAAAGAGDDTVKFFYNFEGDEFWITSSLIIDSLDKALINNLSAGDKVCNNTAPYELFPSIPNGVFSGPVLGKYLDPSKGLGPASVSYTYTNATSGCSATTTVPIYIIKAPDISFKAADVCIESSADSTRFVNMTVSEDTVQSWVWRFSEVNAPDDERKDAAFLYKTGGIHTLSLKATTLHGCTATKTGTIDLGIKPVAGFYWKNDCFSAGNKLQVFDASSSAYPIISRVWNFEDGKLITSDLNPQYVMPDTGYINVKLIVSNSYAACKDTILRKIYLRPTYSISNDGFYSQNFESGRNGWIKDDSLVTKNNWTLGPPDRPVINKAASGSKAWFTKYDLINSTRESSAVISPCFDFTGIERPMISLKTFKRFERNRNGAALQYKLEGSKQWKYVGIVGDGILWYNSSVINGSPGGDKIGWTTLNNDPDTAWTESRHKLDELGGKKNVIFRVVYGSDDVISPGDGFAFDDVWIGERSRNVLLEHFTNTSSKEGSTATSIINGIAAKAHKDLINIQYHTNFPGSDPYFDQNPGDVSARVLSYGLTKIPYSLIDGGNKSDAWARLIDFRTSQPDTNDVSRRSLIDPQFALTINSNVAGGILNVQCKLKALDKVYSNNLVLYIAVTEKENSEFTGANGESTFYNVFRKFIPDAGGIILKNSWLKDEEFTIPEQFWIIQKIKNSANIKVIAFVQDNLTKEIYQAVSVVQNDIHVGIEDPLPGNTIDFSLYPNPAHEKITVAFGEPLRADAEIRIYNIRGDVVRIYKAGSGSQEFSIENPGLMQGIYMVRISSGKLNYGYKKLIIRE